MTDNKLKGLNIPELKHKKVYTQEYVDKLEKENTELKEKIRKKEYQEENYLNKIDHKEEVIKTLQLKIERLEKENEQLRNNGFTVSAMTAQQLKAALEKGEQLEKQLEVAKDLIHQFLIQNPISDWLPKKAENFLKETDNDRKAD